VKGVEPIYSSHVREEFPDFRALFDAGEAADRLGFDHGWAAVMRLVGREIEAIEAQLGGAKPLDHVTYAHLHGQLRGLKSIQYARTALVTRYEVEREEQERKHEGAATAPGR
jgi:hypothetical protein